MVSFAMFWREARFCMKKSTGEWVQKAEEDLAAALKLQADQRRFHDTVGFLSQQCAEKYLKAMLEENGASIPKTHDLERLLLLLSGIDPTLAKLHRGLASLTDFAVDFRYPGVRATARKAQSAVRKAERVRRMIRVRLGIDPPPPKRRRP